MDEPGCVVYVPRVDSAVSPATGRLSALERWHESSGRRITNACAGIVNHIEFGNAISHLTILSCIQRADSWYREIRDVERERE